MLFLLEEYCIGHSGYAVLILGEIYYLLSAYFNKEDNCYLKL